MLVKKESGFTLVEVICVLIILGVLVSVAVPKYISLKEDAEFRAIDAGVAELNGRETLFWSKLIISDVGYIDDNNLFQQMDYDLGTEYTWGFGAPTADGGVLQFKNASDTLTRIISTPTTPAVWAREPSGP